jgi:hypothetical protein
VNLPTCDFVSPSNLNFTKIRFFFIVACRCFTAPLYLLYEIVLKEEIYELLAFLDKQSILLIFFERIVSVYDSYKRI